MAFSVMHRLGNLERHPCPSVLPDLLAKLDPADTEHTDVSVIHDSGWCLSARIEGHLSWENLEGGSEPKHMRTVSAQRIIELWTKLASGDLAGVESEPWQPGYP